MGRDWSWVGGGNGGRSSKTKREAKTTSGCGKKSQASFMNSNNSAISGCMSTVFHLFDFHHFQFPLNTPHTYQSSSSSSMSNNNGLLSLEISLPKGVEAPRNSLESVEEASLSPTIKGESLNISVSMGMHIKTNATRDPRSKLEALSNNDSYSPSTKTPNLVARLMGLDLLPENSPSSSSSSPSLDFRTPNIRTKPHSKSKNYTLHRNSVDGGITGTRSLPETPRISLARRSDADHYQHRLSLQLNKENVSVHKLIGARFSNLRKKELKLEENQNTSPQDYARQIVKQVKHNVSRRVGTDITNTIRSKEKERDHHTSKKTSKIVTRESSTSPKPQGTIQAEEMKELVKRRLQPVKESRGKQKRGQEYKERKPIKKCMKAKKGMKFYSRMVKPPQIVQEEPFVRSLTINRTRNNANHHGDRKCKKMPLSNDLLNFTTIQSLLPLKKDASHPTTKLPHKQVTEAQAPRTAVSQLPSCSSQPCSHIVQENDKTTTTRPISAAAEHEYIIKILKCTGLDKDTPISYAKWFSPSHPLDPSIFYLLEHFVMISARDKSLFGNLTLRSNRKLLFHLVDEILVDLLKPHMNVKPWACNYPIQRRRDYHGSELIDELCIKIGRYPLADCRVLEDIDALIDGDFPEMKRVQGEGAFEEEGETLLAEIEKEILDSLMVETASGWETTWRVRNAFL